MITAHILFFVVCLGDSAVQMLAASTSVRLDEQDLVRRKNVASISTSFYKMLLLTSLVILNFAAAATNDNCVTAKLLQPSADTSPVEVASTVGAATYDFPCVVGSHDSPALFYSFVGTGAKMRISTCSAETAFDTTLLLDTTGSSCENNAFCLVNDGFSKDLECDPSGKAVTGSFYSVSGNKYLLAVQGGNSVNAGTFGLSLLEYIRPENDACSKPQLISPSVHLDSVAEGSTVNARALVPKCVSPPVLRKPTLEHQFYWKPMGATARIPRSANQAVVRRWWMWIAIHRATRCRWNYLRSRANSTWWPCRGDLPLMLALLAYLSSNTSPHRTTRVRKPNLLSPHRTAILS
jgi:hypothetical protein